MRLAVIAALVLVVLVGGYYFAATRQPTPSIAVAVAPASAEASAAPDVASPVASAAATAAEPPSASFEERAAVVIEAMSRSVVRNQYVEELVATGLAQLDAQRIVGEFAHGIAECLFDEARKDSESRGFTREEFLRGAEMIWGTPGSSFDLQRLPSAVAPCATNVSQQAGLPLAVGFESRPRRSGAPEDVPVSASAPSFDEAEAAIHRHIANYPDVALSELFVHCETRGCEILMQGTEDVPIFDFEFDRFAEQNGFRRAALGGDGSLRTVWLQR